nr:unnamed protein product [Callosobruchus analis]
MQGKIDYLKQVIENYHCDILAVSETWLNPKIPSSGVAIGGYKFDRCSRGGGVGFYIASSIKFTVLKSSTTIEQLWLTFSVQEMLVLLLSYIDHHKRSHQNF